MEEKQNCQESSSIFNISIDKIAMLEDLGLDLNGLFLLECYREGTDPFKHIKSLKMEGWRETLKRKALLTQENELTATAHVVFKALDSNIKTIKQLMKELRDKDLSDFDKWWKAFPSTDMFEYGGKQFFGSRGMKTNKEKCKKEFERILNETGYSVDDMIRSLEYEVDLKKRDSLRSGENKLKFMHNSHTYLLQRDFENFMEISKMKKIEENKTINGTFNI